MKVNFAHKEPCHVLFNIQSKVVISKDLGIWSLCSFGPQEHVITWQHHLHEVGVVQAAVLIRVKKLNQVVTIGLCHIMDAIVSEEVE